MKFAKSLIKNERKTEVTALINEDNSSKEPFR